MRVLVPIARHILVLMLLMTATLGAQERKPLTPQQSVAKGMSRLQVSLRLDRTEYLPGEDICAKVEIYNPPGESIDAFPPFQRPRAEFYLEARPEPESPVPTDDWVPMGFGVDDSNMFTEEATSLLRGRGTIEFRSGTKTSESVCRGSGGLLRPGDYRFCFAYAGGACGQFTVVEPQSIVFLGKALLPAYEEQLKAGGAHIRIGCIGIRTAIVNYNDRNVLLSTYRGSSVCGFPAPGIPVLENVLRGMAPFLRVAELPETVRSVSAEPYNDLDIRFTWTGERGDVETLSFVPARRTIRELAREERKDGQQE